MGQVGLVCLARNPASASIRSAFLEAASCRKRTGARPHVPHAGERHGKEQVHEFFDILSRSLTFDRFEPREFIAQGDRVVVLGNYRGRAIGGNAFESEWAMVFTLRNGKVVHFQEFTDSAAINAAFEGAAGGR